MASLVAMDESALLLQGHEVNDEVSAFDLKTFDTVKHEPRFGLMRRSLHGLWHGDPTVFFPRFQMYSTQQTLWNGCSDLLGRFCYAFVPQYFRTKCFNDSVPTPVVGRTSWLGGLRGVASLIVVTYHFVYAFNEFASYPWGTKGSPPVLGLPIIRVFFSAVPMVAIFFVATGYALSLKPLTLMSKGTVQSREELLSNLTSSLFRRWFRLYLPTIAANVLIFLVVRTGVKNTAQPLTKDPTIFLGWREREMSREGTWNEQLGTLWEDILSLCNVFQESARMRFDPHHWTIMAIYRGSLAVYLSLFSIVPLKFHWRLPILFGYGVLILHFCYTEMAAFLWGACIAQVDLYAREKVESSQSTVERAATQPEEGATPPEAPIELEEQARRSVSPIPRQRWLRKCIPRARIGRTYTLATTSSTAAFFLSMFLLSAPARQYQRNSMYARFMAIVPTGVNDRKRILPAYGAALLILTLSISRDRGSDLVASIKRMLTHPKVLYLGRLNFAIYLVHGTILQSFGYLMPLGVWWILGFKGKGVPAGVYVGNKEEAVSAGIGYGVPSTTWVYVTGIAVGWFVNMIMILCVADVFSREVEQRMVQLARWIESFPMVNNSRQGAPR